MSVKKVQKNYTHYIKIDTPIELDNVIDYNIHIVYYINCSINNNYFHWLINQLNLVREFGGTIHLVATISKHKEPLFRERVMKLYPNIMIECNDINEFEYRGILKVWELGKIHNKSNDIILYFHSKGITHHNSYKNNRYDNYNIILKDINKIKEIFSIFPAIDKIGYLVGGRGMIWYNFWYARGSYINVVEKPIKTNRRHYYENWLSRTIGNIDNDNDSQIDRPESFYKNTLNTCYGFHTDAKNIANIGSFYCADTNNFYDNK